MAVMAMCVLLSCTEKKEEATLSGLMKSNFVSEVQGKPTALYVLKNQNGAEACVTNWGGRLVSVMVPDKNGKMTDVSWDTIISNSMWTIQTITTAVDRSLWKPYCKWQVYAGWC